MDATAAVMDAIVAEHSARLAGADPLLPPVPVLHAEDGAELLTATAGESSAAGSSTFTERVPDDPDAIWHTLREHQLLVQLAGPDPEAALERLLDQWDERLAAAGPANDPDSAAIVLRPSRDLTGGSALLRRGFAPVRVTAVRPADRLAGGPATTPGVTIRPAGPADLSTVAGLQLELLRFDAQFGLVTERPGMTELITATMRGALDLPEPSVWIAEVYGNALGMVALQLPGAADWVRPFVAAERVGYLSALAVAEAARGTGVGTALAAHAHQLSDEAGAEVVLLHHALTNPLSTPFWYAQGYRPLWTCWQRRPALR